MVKTEQGYLLWETLIALFITALVSLICIASTQALTTSVQKNHTETLLTSDLLYYQYLAKSVNQSHRFIFQPVGGYDVYRLNTRVHSRRLGEKTRFQPGSLGITELQFTNQGTITRPGSIRVTDVDQVRILMFQLGSGRFYFAPL
ncbi:hypothetical protein FLK61_29855 [Paenalkalicoccus suaedae]|uniref:Competence protein ComGD n=1 Tax=Paenalkalicoccus suaedae TaxID=2592382 RepID=A0A859FDG7_9BACI|nr:hypothetical protein [Paenalkalicoccus suaedae]QKS70930.1 hypothetical protein FLK61_29855 [Paenalkalicoccus suaedae]